MKEKRVFPKIPKYVKSVLRILREAGSEGFLVGGCVRDSLMGRIPHDWDICTAMRPESVLGAFKKQGYTVIPTGLKHGTVTVLSGSEGVEVTTFRTDGVYSDGRHPDKVSFTTNIEDDLARRDFTMNAIGFQTETGRFVDPFHGREDIEKGVIRCVGKPEERLREDYLRAMRAVRFSAVLGFSLDAETGKAVREIAPCLTQTAKERLQVEIMKLLGGPHAEQALRIYADVIAVVIPELKPCFGFRQNNPYHIFDVWEHTLHTVGQVSEHSPILRLAALLHDIGKPSVYVEDDKGIGHFRGHERAGEQLADSILRRLRFDNETLKIVTELVRVHDRNYRLTKAGVRRLLSEIGDCQFERLLMLREADIKAQNPEFAPGRLEEVKQLYVLKNQIMEEQNCFSLKDLAVNGRDLIQMGYASGPEIGQVLHALLDQVIEDPEKNTKEALCTLAKKMLTRQD